MDVIYILSSGHSGSTLLDLLLGSHSQIEGVGEIRSLPLFLLGDTKDPSLRLCTCGRPAKECPYWARVLELASARVQPEYLAMDPSDPAGFERGNHAVFEAVLRASDKRIICDSSKHFRRLAALLRSKQYRVHVVHLVRDGRAVANSMKKKNRRFLRSVWTWQYNLPRALHLAWLRRRRAFELTRVRYEDLARRPEDVLRRILQKHGLDIEPEQLNFSEGEHHNLSGNRMRMKKGQTIEPDTKYLRALSKPEWTAGTVLCAPALLFFGYPLRRPAIAGHSRGVP